MTAPQTPPEVIFGGADLRVQRVAAHPGGPLSDWILMTFDFRKDGRQSFGPDLRRGRLARRGWDHLHLSTRRNDWFLNDDTADAIAAIGAATSGYAHRHLLGYSMGAYGALRYASGVAASHVFVASPVISLLPDRAQWENRYPDDVIFWQAGQSDLSKTARSDVRGVMAFDPQIAADAAHAQALAPLFTGLALLPIIGGGHPATKHLREIGRGGDVLDVALGLARAESLVLERPLDPMVPA